MARRAADILSLAMIAAYVAYLAATWDTIPDVVPSHFNVVGAPDIYGNKSVLLLEPVIALAMWVLLVVVRRVPGAWNFPVRVTPRNRAVLYAIGERTMMALTPLVVFLMLYAGLMGVIDLPVAGLYLALAAVLAVLAVGIVRMLRARDE